MGLITQLDIEEAARQAGRWLKIYNVRDYGATGDGVTDDLTKLQAALNAANTAGGGHVVAPAGTYVISASLVIYSNTWLDLDPKATISLKASSNSNMIHNAAWVAGTGRDSNIQITGGTWARNSVAGTGQQLHSLLMQRVDGLLIQGLTGTSSAGKYMVCVYACTNFLVDRLTFNCASDGVHLQGLCTGGQVSNIYGTTGDDSVALTPVDYTAYQNGDMGDITDVRITGVYTVTTGQVRQVKVLGGTYSATAYGCQRIKIDNIAALAGSQLEPVLLGGDGGQAATLGGYLYDIEVAHVSNAGTTHTVQIANIGSGGIIDNITLRDIQAPNVASRSAVYCNASSATTIRRLTIRDCQFTSTLGQESIRLDGGVVVTELLLDNVYFNPPAGFYAVQLIGTNTTLTTLKVNNCRLNVQTNSGGLVRTNAATTPTFTNMFITNLTVDQCAWVIGDIGSAVSVNVTISGLTATTISGLVNARSGTTVTLLSAEGMRGTNVFVNGSTGTFNTNTAPLASPTYSTSITPNATAGPWQTITVTNATAFTINAPVGPPGTAHTRELTVEVYNNSGGAMGTITWNAAFGFAGLTWANPATTKKRYARFEWNGSKWVCIALSAADY